MPAFILPLTDERAADPEQVGPKAANLASLTQSGLPTPGGFALTAEAYRRQVEHLGIAELIEQYKTADIPTTRRLSIAIRLAIYEKPIAPEILEPLLEAWRAQRADGSLGAIRSSALIEDREGREFRRPIRELSRHQGRNRIPDRRAGVLGRAVDVECAPLHGQSRPLAGRDRDGRADPAARLRACLGRRFERDRGRAHAHFCDVGPRLGYRARRGRARPHRAIKERFRALDRSGPQGSSRYLRAWRGGAAARAERDGERAVPDGGRSRHPRPPVAQM